MQLIGQNYKHVIVVLNAGGIIDTTFFAQINARALDPAGGKPLDSMLLMSQAGEESGNAVAEVLDGQVSPSGKLTDTWASKYSYYPASATFGNNDGNITQENYNEGIYVGYRYFDSFAKTIIPADPAAWSLSVRIWPVLHRLPDRRAERHRRHQDGHGQGQGHQRRQDLHRQGGRRRPTSRHRRPRRLDKPYQELAGYAKTDDLAPGASQILTITYDTTQMSSYDPASASYVMDAGRLRHPRRRLLAQHPRRREDQPGRGVDHRAAAPTRMTDQSPGDRADQRPGQLLHLPGRGRRDRCRAVDLAEHRRVRHAERRLARTSRTTRSTARRRTTPTRRRPRSPRPSAYVDPTQTNWEGTGCAVRGQDR